MIAQLVLPVTSKRLQGLLFFRAKGGTDKVKENYIRVLLIEDDEDDYTLIKDLLSAASSTVFDLMWEKSYGAGLEAACSLRHDICLLDYRLGDGNGLELMRELAGKGHEAPVVFLTELGGYEVDKEALRMGAADYLVKRQIGSELLERSIRHSIERKRIEKELWLYRNHLKEMVDERTAQLERANGILRLEIAERKRAEEALRHAKDDWEQTFNAIPDLVAILDNHFKIVRVNRAMADRLGLEPDKCVGLKCHELIHGSNGPPSSCPHVLACSKNVEHVVEVHEPRLNGHFLVSATPRFDENGQRIGTVHVARDITERKEAEETIRHLALHDPLTDLPNRSLFFDRLSQALSRANRNKNLTAILYMDLDGFKAINDTLGHEAGDEVLVGAAKRLRECIRETDTAARLGGDEFAVILQDIGEKQFAEIIAERIIESFARPFLHRDRPCALKGISIGISIYPLDADDAYALLKKADRAMYAAKKSGSGRYTFCDSLLP